MCLVFINFGLFIPVSFCGLSPKFPPFPPYFITPSSSEIIISPVLNLFIPVSGSFSSSSPFSISSTFSSLLLIIFPNMYNKSSIGFSHINIVFIFFFSFFLFFISLFLFLLLFFILLSFSSIS